MGTCDIREFAEDDWPAVWAIVRTVTAATETYCYPPRLTEKEGRDIWIEHPPALTVIAADAAGHIVGTAKMGPNRPGPGSHVATASFMVAEGAPARIPGDAVQCGGGDQSCGGAPMARFGI